MAKTCAVLHQKLVQDQRKTRLISWQYFTKRLTRQCHHLCSSDYEIFLFNLLYKRLFLFKNFVHLLFGVLPC